MDKCKYPEEACINMLFYHGKTYCESVPCSLKDELPPSPKTPHNSDLISRSALLARIKAEHINQAEQSPSGYFGQAPMAIATCYDMVKSAPAVNIEQLA